MPDHPSVASETVFTNARWADERCTLTVVVPFLRDNPVVLIQSLAREHDLVELVVLDDGTNDPAIARAVELAIQDFPGPACFINSHVNLGRSKGRNRLIAQARSGHLLFLDADMLPDNPDFLRQYVGLIKQKNPDVVFGGFSVRQAKKVPETALHRALAVSSDCRPAAERALAPGKTICTSNLLVRRNVFDDITFDESFKGWGWEDVDWGIRAAARFQVLHLENSATHLGLENAQQLVAKFKSSGGNFGHLARLHPEEIKTYPSYRAAAFMRRVPMRSSLTNIAEFLTLDRYRITPLGLRVLALKLLRACIYADHINENSRS